MSTTHQTQSHRELAKELLRPFINRFNHSQKKIEVYENPYEKKFLGLDGEEWRMVIQFSIFMTIALFLAFWAISCEKAMAGEINLNIIAQIESSGCVNKVSNRAGDESYGCHQITPILLKEYNQMTKHSYSKADLLNNKISEQIADWYLHKRIPQMLKHYGKPVTLENQLTAYNKGIGNVLKGNLATNYINKYRKLGGDV